MRKSGPNVRRASGTIAAALITLCTLYSCRTTGTVRDFLDTIPAKNLGSYIFSPDSELTERVNVSSDIVMGYLEDFDDPDGNYSLYEPAETELKLLDGYFHLLPARYQEILTERLVGVYFVENFHGSGMADYVLSQDGKVYAILVLNPIVFEKDISGLLTWKERTNFRPDESGYNVRIEVTGDYSGLLYILAHECTHIVDYVDRVTPYVEPVFLTLWGKAEGTFTFTEQYWSDYDKVKTRLEYKDRLDFYGTEENKKIPDMEIPSVYEELETTLFVSLYSYLNWAEDLAEYCAMYLIARTLGLSYTIRVAQSDITLLEYRPFDNPAVLARAKYLDFLVS